MHRIRGCSPEVEPFRRLLNQNHQIPTEPPGVHGYTRKIQERNSEPRRQVYQAFAAREGNQQLVTERCSGRSRPPFRLYPLFQFSELHIVRIQLLCDFR